MFFYVSKSWNIFYVFNKLKDKSGDDEKQIIIILQLH